MPDTRQPRCPHCGAATPFDEKTLLAGVKDEWNLMCNTCRLSAPAGEWMKDVDADDTQRAE